MQRTRWLTWGWVPIWLALWAWHISSIGHIPAGLFHDEAFNALDALHLPDQGWPVFLPGNFGREPLLVYGMALSMRLFGPTVWSVRLPVALAWGLTIPAFVWLLREMFPDLRQRVLFFAGALVLMTSLWFAITAHYAIRTNVFVLLETLFVAALWRGWRRGDVRWGMVAGIFWGASFYTYLANRLLPFVLLGPLLWLAIKAPRRLRERRAFLAATFFTALLVMLPLLLYFLHHPQEFLLRTSQVALVGGAGQTDGGGRLQGVWRNTGRVLGMFFFTGDRNPRNDIPGRPVFTWWAAPLLLGGIWATWRRRDARGGFLLWWAFVMMWATWLSEYAPHFQRAIGAVPPVMALVGLGAEALVGALAKGRWKRVAPVVILLLVLGEAVQGGMAFRRWAAMPELYYAFDEGLTAVARYVGEMTGDDVVYLTPRDASHPTLRFFLEASGKTGVLRSFDGRHVLVLVPDRGARYIVLSREDFRFALMAPWLWPRGGPVEERTFYDRAGEVYARVFRVAAHTPVRSPLWQVRADWEDHIRLLGADPIGCCVYKPGDRIYLQLWWTAVGGTPRRAWTVFTHVVDSTGRVLAGKDCEPGCGSYPTQKWHVGEWVVAEYQIVLPKTMSPGEYTIEIGLYDWRSGRRLPLSHRTDDALPLGRIRVTAP